MSKAGYIKQVASLGVVPLFMLLWVYAATAKILEFDQFKVQLSQVDFLKPLAEVLVWFIPLVEYGLAGLLLVGQTRWLGFVGSALVMSIFTIYIAGMISFSPELPCSCGGIINIVTWQQHLVFNLFVTALAYWGCYRYHGIKRPNAKL